jgi:prolyl-tRNA editing enzyme YbaK/EbsC (Cys-tRNA(Pro) deacylase)
MPNQPLTPGDLGVYLHNHQIAAELIGGLGETPTVPAAAIALGVEPDQIIKTLLFLVETGHVADALVQAVVVISHGQKRVDKGALAGRWAVSKKRVQLAPAEVVVELLGYPAGGVPPFGHQTVLPVIVDESILGLRQRYQGIIFGGGGDDRTMMRTTVDELLRVTNAEILAVGAEK